MVLCFLNVIITKYSAIKMSSFFKNVFKYFFELIIKLFIKHVFFLSAFYNSQRIFISEGLGWATYYCCSYVSG